VPGDRVRIDMMLELRPGDWPRIETQNRFDAVGYICRYGQRASPRPECLLPVIVIMKLRSECRFEFVNRS